jgi:hypothetical protein
MTAAPAETAAPPRARARRAPAPEAPPAGAEAASGTGAAVAPPPPEAEDRRAMLMAQVEDTRRDYLEKMTAYRQVVIEVVGRSGHGMCETGTQNWMIKSHLPRWEYAELRNGRQAPGNAPKFPEIAAFTGIDITYLNDHGLESYLEAVRAKIESVFADCRTQVVDATDGYSITGGEKERALAALGLPPPRPVWKISIQIKDYITGIDRVDGDNNPQAAQAAMKVKIQDFLAGLIAGTDGQRGARHYKEYPQISVAAEASTG